ncbi:PD-(D/E)XK nuclease family protein [Paenibacillus sp. JMULE4]|uniref:PD-(D/E)XK nuclease family protein n=1 Tax=Paenibacillus sp. JMULE4 TaxID=2518342 RepID=UPI00157539A6|nr:PD-(D/E)XK nuclease family protein [Paenibacillus sp. JMULE4]NTZ17290.1 PD-(D/E)XK nuclease family protein [Paenibacillus sp. JMULE4]
MKIVGTFLERLYDAIRREPFRRKIVIAPSYIEGQSWLMRICRELGPVMNVEVQTVQSFVRSQVQFSLYQQGLTLIGEQRSFWIIHHVMEQMASKPDSYIAVDQVKPGIAMHVHQAIMDLRRAGVSAGELRDDHFMSQQKGSYVRKVLSAYERFLNQRSWIDFPGLLSHIPTQLPENVELILPDPMPLSPVSARMLERLSNGRMTRIIAVSSFTDVQSTMPFGKVQFYHATGRLAEVREALRRIIQGRMPLDEVEMIVPDEEYALVISTMCASFGIPCSYADGLPVITSGMGRAAHFLLNWLESGYQVRQLVLMLQQQLITFSDRDQGITNADCIRALEKSGIGWGKERYIKLLGSGHVRFQGDADERPEERERTEQQQRDDDIKKHLTNLLGELFPDEAALSSPKGIWGWLVNILDRFGVCGTEEDAIVLQEMKGIAKELQECPVPDSMPFQQMFLYARDMLQELRVGVQRLPKPGFLYISSLANGGISGRKHTFLLGMDEQSWSGNIRQNPMLLDEECRRIGAGLQTAVQRQRDRQRLRDGRLGMISGNITFSFSSYDLAEGATASPAFQLLQVFRKVSGETNADYEMLHRSLGEPVGYLDVEQPSSTELNGLPLDAFHYVFRQIHANVNLMRDRQSFIESVYPSLRQGRLALEARGSSQVTEHDGYIAGDEWADYWRGQAERTLSASQLEKYAECPMRYFFQYVLEIRVKDQVTFDRTSWLKPNERGSLLHEVYRRYMTEISASNTMPITHDHARLLQIAEETILSYAERIPAPSPHVFERERQAMLWDVDVFYRMELQAKTAPRFFEQELIVDGQPLHLELGEDMAITLRGIVDRIDQVAPHQYRIIDYKTGSPRPYKENGMFAGGTQLQHALYAMGTELWMRQTGVDSDAKVLEASYVFPSERGHGQVITRSQTERHRVTAVIRGILSSMEQGLFIPASDPGVCRYCDFAAVCGDHAEMMADKRKDEVNSELLYTLLEVENIE